MPDPLSEVVSLLQPGAPFSKLVSGAGRWSVRRTEPGRPFYCVILQGAAYLQADEHPSLTLEAGDFVLIPAAHRFTMASIHGAYPPDRETPAPIALPDGEFRHGAQDGAPDVRLLVGYCAFTSQDSDLLVSLLPQLVHVRGERRLTTLVQLVADECRERRPARDVILARLLEVLLIEALRGASGGSASHGLLRGLADERLAAAIRSMHAAPTRSWTVAQLAREAALSRSAFFERFSRALGVAPMAYLLSWRMALAKRLLRQEQLAVGEVAQRVGYRSASTFSVAFSRHVGMPPVHFARRHSPSTTARA